jgi:hypothetical protein
VKHVTGSCNNVALRPITKKALGKNKFHFEMEGREIKRNQGEKTAKGSRKLTSAATQINSLSLSLDAPPALCGWPPLFFQAVLPRDQLLTFPAVPKAFFPPITIVIQQPI